MAELLFIYLIKDRRAWPNSVKGDAHNYYKAATNVGNVLGLKAQRTQEEIIRGVVCRCVHLNK